MELSKTELYKEIMARLPLLPKDRESLRVKRGFSDAVIDKMGFKSCGPFIRQDEFFESVPDDIFNALVKENIVIPYFDATGNIMHIRPHKFGISGEGVNVYIPFAYLSNDCKKIVLAESEFKALASCLMGVPAIGIPGIKSHSRSKLENLFNVIKALGSKEVVVCFDNEIKDNPKYPNFKKDYTKRYDTQQYAYIMAKILNHDGVKCRVATLNSEWMQEGKADIDGVLAQGIDPLEYQKCIRKTQSAADYKSSWKFPSSHVSFLERRIEWFFYTGPIHVEYNCYYRGNPSEGKKLTNFVIKVIHTIYGGNGAERFCRFYSNYGNSKSFMVTAEVMSSKAAFIKFCYEQGDYEFNGNDDDLKKIWHYIFMRQSGRMITKLQTYGYSDDDQLWFFGNGAYFDDQFSPIDDDGIVWVHDNGYKLFDNSSKMEPPILSQDEKDVIDLKEIYMRMQKALGSSAHKDQAKIIIGWALGNFFMPEILKDYGIYPFLFLHGRKEGGKSTIANWISAFFGMEIKGYPLSGSTAVGITRITTQMSMLPVWLEEYRNKDQDISRKNTFLRSVYDKSTIIKGTKNVDEIKSYTARSSLIISGEEHPHDAALNSRCVMLEVFANSARDKDTTDYKWLQQNKSLFNNIGHHLLMNRKSLWPKVKARIEEYLESFSNNDELKVQPRTKLHMSMIAGVCDVLLGESQSFSHYVGLMAATQQEKRNSEEALYIFFQDVADMDGINKLNYAFLEKRVSDEGGKKRNYAVFYFSAVYASWEFYYKGIRNDIPASKNALFDHIRREEYYMDTKPCRIGDTLKRCVVLDMDHKDFPESLHSIIMSKDQKGMYGAMAKESFRYADKQQDLHTEELDEKAMPL